MVDFQLKFKTLNKLAILILTHCQANSSTYDVGYLTRQLICNHHFTHVFKLC